MGAETRNADIDRPEAETAASDPAPSEATEAAGRASRNGKPSQRAENRSNRIMSVVATEALNLTAQEALIDFRVPDHAKLPEWIQELDEAHNLGRLIRRLRHEVGDENGSDETGIEDSPDPD